MERTKNTAAYGFLKGPQLESVLALIAVLVLPFASYLGLGLLGLLLIVAFYQRGQRMLSVLWQQGFMLLTLGLIVSTVFSLTPGNSLLQLANFVPYFWMFSAVLTSHTALERPIQKLTFLAQSLVFTSLPISLMALLEYSLKIPAIATHVSGLSMLGWVFNNDFGHRAHAILSHPNTLSSYLVMIVGLGLGLIWQFNLSIDKRLLGHTFVFPALLYGATGLGLIGIFCAGSRNGIIVAVVQLLVLGCIAQRSRFLILIGLGGVMALILSTLVFGIGGRQISVELMSQDPRVGVWQMAIDLIRQRPFLGWGLGSFSALYVPDSVPGYPHIYHAHNIWLYLASETGIPVMVGFCVVIGQYCFRGATVVLGKALSDNHRAILLGYLLAFGGCVLFGFFDVALFDSRINVLNWVMLAGVSILANAKPNPNLLNEFGSS